MPGVTTAYQNGIHSARPAANSGCILYACSTHSLIYRSDGSTWTTWMTIGSSTTTVANDAIWDAAGDLAVGTGADTAAKLTLTAPAANILNVLGVANGETTPTWKAIHDGTAPVTQAFGDTAAAGTSLLAAHRDHKHGMPSYPVFHGCLAYNSALQALNATTLTYMALNAEDHDTDSMHDTVTNNSRVAAPVTGKYRVAGQIFYATTSGTNYVLFDKNHAGVFIRGVPTDNGGASGMLASLPAIALTAGDYIEMVGYHTQAGSINTGDSGTTPSQQNYLSLELIGV